MPSIPIRYSASSSRESSETLQEDPSSLDTIVPRGGLDIEQRDGLLRRDVKFNPALIPLLPLSTLNAVPPDMFLSTRRPEEELAPGAEFQARSLEPRQQQPYQQQQTTGFIPYSYKGIDSGPKPGVVVGIVLGAVAGAVFVYWLFIFVLFQAPRTGLIEGDEQRDIIIERHHRSSKGGHRRRKRRRSHRSNHSRSHSVEMSEHKTEHRPSPARSPSRTRRAERIIHTETKRTSRSQAPPIIDDTITSPTTERHETVFEARETRVTGDDEVEVFEEHDDISDRPKRSSKKSGFRTVDPNEYGGGNYPQREVYSRRASRSNR